VARTDDFVTVARRPERRRCSRCGVARAALPALSLCAVPLFLSGCAGGISSSTTGNSGPQYEVNLSWTPPSGSDEIAGYNIYRAASNSASFQQLNSSLDTSTVFVDSNVQSGISYSYFVVAVDMSGNWSLPSDLSVTEVP